MVVKYSKNAVSVKVECKGCELNGRGLCQSVGCRLVPRNYFYCGCCDAKIVYKSHREVVVCPWCFAMWKWKDETREEIEGWKFIGFEKMPEEQKTFSSFLKGLSKDNEQGPKQ